MKKTNLELLFQDHQTRLTTAKLKLNLLINLNDLLKKTYEALQYFLARQFEKFDPHVGETSCQIRAYILFLMQNKLRNEIYLIELKKDMKKLIVMIALYEKNITELNDDIQGTKGNGQAFVTEKLIDFLLDRNLVFDLSQDTIFLIQAYFLTKFKTKNTQGDHFVDYERICKNMRVSRKLSKKLIHYYQVKLSEHSIEFIYNLTTELTDSLTSKHVLKKLQNHDDDYREVLPCYIVMKTLIQHMLIKRCPIFMIIKRQQQTNLYDHICLLFEPNQDGTQYDLIKDCGPEDHQHNKECVVIENVTIYPADTIENRKQFIERVISIGLIEIILANMAVHPQYSGHKLNALSYNPYIDLLNNHEEEDHGINAEANELLRMKTYGNSIGCCEYNPSLIFIRHIFCGNVKNQINSIYNTTRYHSASVIEIDGYQLPFKKQPLLPYKTDYLQKV